MKAVGYVRVSTEMQAAEGVSLDAQRQRLEAWAQGQGVELLAIEADAGLSGSRADNRPGLQRAIAAACEAKSPLVVYSLSRLARSTKDAINIIETLNRAGSSLVSLSERIDGTSASGRLSLTMMIAFSQCERDQISERTKTALQWKRKMGQVTGNVPYGFTAAGDGKMLVADAVEQGIARRIKAMAKRGKSLRFIASSLNQRGIQTKTGKAPWSAGTIHYMLKHSLK